LVLFSPVRPIFSRFPAFALFKVLILYVTILLGNFVWLLNISTRPAYRALSQNATIYLYDPTFSPDPEGYPYPFSRLEVWNFADDATKIVAVDPVICSPGSRSPLRRLCRPRRRDLCPPIPIISRAPTSYYDGYQFAIVPNNPGFFIQFQSETTGAAALDDPEEPWAYCVNHTTPTKASIPMCMGVVSRSSTDNSSVVPAGLRYCPDITNCPNVVDSSMVPPANILILNMTIQTALLEAIISWDGSIASAQQIQKPQPFTVNMSEFFTAFGAPLMPDIPISVGDIELYTYRR
jgi:hypothetical protein